MSYAGLPRYIQISLCNPAGIAARIIGNEIGRLDKGNVMTRMLVAYFAALVVFVGVDMLWLGIVARGFYKAQLGSLLAEKPVLAPAIAFYLLFVLGLVIFGVSPALRDQSWRSALVQSALFGFFAYATYDLTNMATLKDWPMTLSLVDLAWGTVLAGVAGLCAYVAASSLA